MAWAARYHINGLQFYGWQYRHEQLLPPEDPYTDPLGRRLSLETVTRLIDAAHARNIAAMPYTAIYGATPAFYEQHPDWALFQADGVPFDFGDGFLKIMNPTPGSPWADHLLDQFAQVLDQTAFDGIHLDQYGARSWARQCSEPVDLAECSHFHRPGRQSRARASRGRRDDVQRSRQLAVETVAPSDQDSLYRSLAALPRLWIGDHRTGADARRWEASDHRGVHHQATRTTSAGECGHLQQWRVSRLGRRARCWQTRISKFGR